MDSFIIEILPFIILAILFAGKKNKKKAPATEGMPPFPAPAGNMTMRETPPHIPEPKKEKKRVAPPPLPETPRRTTTDSANGPTQVTADEVATNNEFTIHSNDEARKAIVWGEILRRKY